MTFLDVMSKSEAKAATDNRTRTIQLRTAQYKEQTFI
jgi:hypothetical protein